MRKFMPSAAQPLPFQTPTDLLDVHDTLCWWFISYLGACSNIISLDTSDSEGVSSSLFGKGNSRRDVSPVGLSLVQSGTEKHHLLMSGQVLVFKACFSFLYAVETHTSRLFSTKKSTRNHMNVGAGETPCLTQMYTGWAAFQQLQFLLLGSSPRTSNTPQFLFWILCSWLSKHRFGVIGWILLFRQRDD